MQSHPHRRNKSGKSYQNLLIILLEVYMIKMIDDSIAISILPALTTDFGEYVREEIETQFFDLLLRIF